MEEVLAADLSDVLLAVAPFEQLVNQVWVGRDVLKTLGHLRDAIEIGPEAHVVGTDQLGNVVDVIGHVSDVGSAKPGLFPPLLALQMVRLDMLEDFLSELLELGIDGGINEHRAEVDLHDTALLSEQPDHVVAHVPVPAGGEATARGMGRRHRRLGELQHLMERLVGDVRHVDHHADAIHPGDQLLAEGAQAVPFRAVIEGGVADVVVFRVRQRDVSNAALVEMLHVAEIVFEGRAVLDSQENRDPSAAKPSLDPADGGGDGELVRPLAGEPSIMSIVPSANALAPPFSSYSGGT